MIQEAWVLMRKSVVVLLPYVGGQDQVQGSDLMSPRKLVANLQPFCVLSCHRVYDTDKCLIACEESVTSCKQVAFKPAFAHKIGRASCRERVQKTKVVVSMRKKKRLTRVI